VRYFLLRDTARSFCGLCEQSKKTPTKVTIGSRVPRHSRDALSPPLRCTLPRRFHSTQKAQGVRRVFFLPAVIRNCYATHCKYSKTRTGRGKSSGARGACLVARPRSPGVHIKHPNQLQPAEAAGQSAGAQHTAFNTRQIIYCPLVSTAVVFASSSSDLLQQIRTPSDASPCEAQRMHMHDIPKSYVVVELRYLRNPQGK
jgi:hypothetical protein